METPCRISRSLVRWERDTAGEKPHFSLESVREKWGTRDRSAGSPGTLTVMNTVYRFTIQYLRTIV